MYCTYLTIYSGNLLPPFYIGYTKVSKISKDYHGTVSSRKYKDIWISELKHRPHLFKTKILSLHDNIIDAQTKEIKLQTFVNAHKNPLYINMHIAAKRFGASDKVSEETKRKMSNAKLGSKCYMFGVPKTEEHKRKISQTRIINGTAAGKNNPMFGRNHSPNTIRQISKTKVERNKGQTEKFIKANPKSRSISNGILTFNSMNEAARHFKIHKRNIPLMIASGDFYYL